MSGLINKAKEALSSNKHHDNTTTSTDHYGTTTSTSNQYDNPQSANEGPHKSNMMNKMDSRVDSDRDYRNESTSHTGGYGQTQGAGGYGTSGTAGTGAGYGFTHSSDQTYGNPQSTNAGPHGSNMMNSSDPRVDSDRDHRNDPTSRVGGYGESQNAAGYGNTGPTTGAGYGSATTSSGHRGTSSGTGYGSNTSGQTYDNPHSTNAGPHGSNMMNTMDPRVDSDRDHRNDPISRVGGYGTQDQTQYGTSRGATGAGTGYGSTTTGSGAGAGYDSSMTPGSGNTNKTAGPHNSDTLNKLDPRVDSDMSGGKTYGGNATHR